MSNYIKHAKREFLALGYKPISECEDDPNKWIQENIMELLEVFGKQGHSGSSAPFCVRYFEKLASFEPLSPLQGTDDEWEDISRMSGKPQYQNKRFSSVFKDAKDGGSYFIGAIVFRGNNNSCYTGTALDKNNNIIRSSQNISFPFVKKTFYVDIIEKEIRKDDWDFYIKDEKQLEEALNYFKSEKDQPNDN